MGPEAVCFRVVRPSVRVRWVGGIRDRLAVSLLLKGSTYDTGGSVAEWLACWTQAQKGLGSNRSRDPVG